MKIVILGLITVAFTNVAMAAPSDKGGKDDMILEQMKDLRHQLQQQQHVIKELKEEQVRRDEDQQYKMEELKEKQERSVAEQERRVAEQERRDQEQERRVAEQERRHQEQERRVEEVTKIQRTRRSENETVEHLKELVLAEIKPMIDNLSECAIGTEQFISPTSTGHLPEMTTRTIPFGRNFTQTPKVVLSLKGYRLSGRQHQDDTLFANWVRSGSITTTQFDLTMDVFGIYLYYYEATWVACA